MSERATTPRVDASAFIAPGATLIGRVDVGPESSVWFGCVLRGDEEPIAVGAGSNVQDLTVVHTDPGFPTVIGNRVTIGHRAVIHGSVLEDGCLVGIGAILLTGSRIGAGALVAAGAVVREGFTVPAGTLAAGLPAKVLRELTGEERRRLEENSLTYVALARSYREGRIRP